LVSSTPNRTDIFPGSGRANCRANASFSTWPRGVGLAMFGVFGSSSCASSLARHW
jgi:hypothetical protein